MRGAGTALRVGLAMAAFLVSLGFVTWRQSRALEELALLDQARARASAVAAGRVELERRIQFLESRARVVPAAEERLGMHTPDASELVILPGEARP